jgi:hypothetical protein
VQVVDVNNSWLCRGKWSGWPVRFAVYGQPLCWIPLYHSLIVLFCVVLGLKLLLLHHSWLSFGKFKDIRFSYPILPMFCHDCPLAVKPASSPWCLLPKQTWRRHCLSIDLLLSAMSVLAVVPPSLEVLEGLNTDRICCNLHNFNQNFR